MPRLGPALRRLIPPTPLSKRLATQSLLFATAEGTFLTGSAVFFTQVVGLRAAQVGLGLTIAGVVSFLVAYPAGKLTDWVGPKRMWAAGALVAALMFAAWPFIGGFAGYLTMVVCFEIVENAAGAGRNAYILDVMPEDERVATQAYMYSALNVGFTLGAIIGGVALAFDNLTVMRWLPLFTLAIGVANAVFIARLPQGPPRPEAHDLRRRRSAERAAGPWSPAQRGLDVLQHVQRDPVDQPGPAERRHPPVAGAGHGRSALAARLAVRDQHRDVHLPPRLHLARRRDDHRRPAVRADLGRLLRPLVPDHDGHPQHRGPAHDLPGVARPRGRDRCRALHLRRQLGVPGQADGSAAAR